jgi:hypothetical protein
MWPVLVCLTTLFQLCEFVKSVLNDGIGGVVAHMNAVSQRFVGRTEENGCHFSRFEP